MQYVIVSTVMALMALSTAEGFLHYPVHPFYQPTFRSPWRHFGTYDPYFPTFGAHPFYSPFYNTPRDVFSTLSSEINKAFEEHSGKDEELSFCEYHIQKTPQYSVKEVSEGLVLEVELPNVDKENIQLDFNEENKLSLQAVFVNTVQGGKAIEQQPQETAAEQKQIETQEDGKEGLVVIDEEEEGQKKEKSEKKEGAVTGQGQGQVSGEAGKCKIYGEYKTSFRIPKDTSIFSEGSERGIGPRSGAAKC
jgi:HSP20 family molecular chaperone IbpA